MELAECYRLLELKPDADVDMIKASYRRLARRYHPDVNPNNREEAHQKFIQVTEAYKLVLERVSKQEKSAPSSSKTEAKTTVKRKSPPASKFDQKVKWEAYEQLQDLLQQGKFVRATTLVESLAKRFPNDSEVRQWQGITYQQRGRQLIKEQQFDLARTFLKKALSTDPHNRRLWYEVDRDFQRLDPLL
ncbi:DnaJ domain-containing protein [Dactylococcopsis salina]|uniref:DnaJ-class molecular chaperone with C-terminal Zn finger domain n=1 Tax=Dactylococcopsis salina (strain PCC 8305) TaxID=13035 RepID=K9YV75_DACS8|nr:DnaJ domain-containing protein [Dactylococcopsis salina]AFZ50225.1 DnaJ-class molecular chaperone with C-terminal Zn finger domain [Dactylococcopsis salina PCC 8305]